MVAGMRTVIGLRSVACPACWCGMCVVFDG